MLFYTDYSLAGCNTFGIKARASVFAEIGSAQDLGSVLQRRKYRDMPRLILGNGSNMLFTKDFDGIVLRCAVKGLEIIAESEGEAVVKAGSGVDFDDFAAFCAQKRFYGPEFLSGIPGSVGGAAVQNIGAYGHELRMFAQEVEYCDMESGEVKSAKASDCGFGYRDSAFKGSLKGKAFILSATFRLPKGAYNPDISYGNLSGRLADFPVLSPQIVRRAVLETRNEKIPDPKTFGNAGSFFKNPEVMEPEAQSLASRFPGLKMFPQPGGKVKIPAGQLIDLCGFKQMPDAKVGVAQSNALIMLNLGGASGNDVVAYAKKIQKTVKGKFGIKLEPEVEIV